MALSALAFLSGERDEPLQAVALERRALAIRNTLPNLVSRAISHHNLGNYLGEVGKVDDAAAHELATLVYFVVIGHHQHLQSWVENYAVNRRHAQRASRHHTPPRLTALLARPDFAALRDWLTAGQADLDQLQEAVDDFVARCREAADRLESQGPVAPPL